jgi:autotransporter-associated beta strand protein
VSLPGGISGLGTVVSSGNGVLRLAATNTFSGPLVLASGITAVSSDASLGGTGATLSLAGGALLLDAAFGATARNINVADAGSKIYVPATSTFSGVVSNSVSAGEYTKAGGGTLVMTGAHTFNQLLRVDAGTLIVSGAAGRLFNNVGAAGSISVSDGATFVIDNSAANLSRIGNATMSLAGGDFKFTPNASVNSNVVSTGTLNIGTVNNSGAGLITFRLDNAAAVNTSVQFNRMNRVNNNGTMVRFVGNALGVNTNGSLTPNASNLSFTNAPALTNGIIPWAIVDTNDGNVDFATNVGTTVAGANGVRRYTAYAADFSAGATSNVAVSTITAPNVTVNALKALGGTITLDPAGLNVNSGGILVTGATTISGGTLSVNSGNTVNFFADADLTVSSRINTVDPGGLNSGIAKSGNGILTLSAPNTYVGPTRLLSGTLRLGVGNAVPSNSELFVAPGATFDTNGLNATIGSLNQTNPFFTVGNHPVGAVNLGANTLVTGGDGLSTSINLAINGTGTFIKNGVGTLTVAGPQAFTGTVTINNGALSLATHLTDGIGFANASRINIGVGAGSVDPTLAFEHGLRDGYAVPIFVNVPSGRVATLKFNSGPDGTPGVTFNSPINNVGSIGMVIDSSGGTTIAGVISGVGPVTTASSDGVLTAGPDGFALNITGNNTYSGATTLTAISTLFGHPNAFGVAASAINLGSAAGDDMPELASSVGGITLTRNVTVVASSNIVPNVAYIGSRAPAGSTTTMFSGGVHIAGSRNRLVLFSSESPVALSGVISAGTTSANVQIGRSYGPGLETTRSTVVLSGQNTYAGGTRLVVGTLGFGTNSTVGSLGITSGPIGTATLTIGTTQTPAGNGPTLVATSAIRTVANPIVVASNFSVSGSNALTLSGPVNLNGGARVITVNDPAQLTLTNVVSGAAGSALVKEGAGRLVLNSTNTYSGPTVAGEGTLTFAATQRLGALLAVAGGATANLTSGGGKVIVAPSVAVDATNGGRLDLTDNAMIVDYTGASPFAAVNALIATGRGPAGTWTGAGITSSTAAASIGGPNPKAVGINESAVFGQTTFAGEPVDSTALLIRYTFAGDANLDGFVDITDLGLLATNWQLSGQFWWDGDFTYDGMVDITDLGLLATNWQQSLPLPREVLPGPDPANHPDAVPEPASAGAVALALSAASTLPRPRRRRRRRRRS